MEFVKEKGKNNGNIYCNAQIKNHIKTHKPSIWQFCKKLNEFISTCDQNYIRVENGHPVSRKRTSRAREERDAFIEKQEKKLLSGTITKLKFLKSVAHTLYEPDQLDRYDCPDDANEQDEDRHEQNSEEELQIPNDDRRRCWDIRTSTKVFIPCGQCACSQCADRLFNEHSPCGQCRQTIEQVYRIYNV